jgi:predicted O-linked N-acetylglucosamine transferase (SPINDLY family)
VDYLVADSISAPPGGEQKFAERLVRIDPCRLCYSPPADAPPVAPAPALARGHVTFGSFNRLSKLAPPVIEAWSAILDAVPASRIVLKNPALHDAATRARLLARFAQHGIAAERIETRGFTPHRRMLEEYGDIDIALDPFPYNGGLTTCEALWMGVPVLCLVGRTLISRQTAAILAAAGIEGDAVDGVDALVRRAVERASDVEALARERAAMRERIARSPLVDGAGFARKFGSLLEELARG